MEHDEEVKDDVEEMLKAFGEQIEDAPAEGEPSGDEPKEESPVEDKPTDEPVATDTPTTDAPTTDSPTTDAPEEDEKDKTIRELREKLAEKEKVKEPELEPEQPPEPPPLTFEEQDFIGDIDLDELARDPKEFNNLLNNLYKKAVTDTRNLLAENILRAIPEIVRSNITVMDNLKKASDEFYTNNQDLQPFKKVVATVFEEVASNNPGKPFEDLFPMVADEARKRLDLHKQVTQPQPPKPPRLPSRKGRVQMPKETPNPDPLLTELEEMNKTLRR